MNLAPLFELQKKLEAANRAALTTIPAANSETLKTKRILAVTVELAEFANEWAGFKYWKPQHQINAEKLGEEYADVMHFLCAFANMLDLEPVINARVLGVGLDEQMIAVFREISLLQNDFSKTQLKKIFELYLGVGKIIGYSDDMILQVYKRKNAINIERIKKVPDQFRNK